MSSLGKFLRGFRYAAKGIAASIGSERNLRFHLTAAVLVNWVSLRAGLRGAELGMIELCCALVIALELVNTAIEMVCDKVSPEQDPLIGKAKDAAAGAVLATAFFSVIIGILLLGGWVFGGGLITYITDHIAETAAFCAVTIIGIIFVFRK